MDEYIKFKADEFGFYNGVDFLVYAVQVQNAVHVMLIADNGKPKNPQNIGMLTGSAYCHEEDTFDLDYGVRLAVERAIKGTFPSIWKGFRRAQWHKLHDVSEELISPADKEIITHWVKMGEPAGLTVSDGKISLDEMTFHRIDTDDDGWISVEKELPEALGDIYRASIDVEAKDKDGAIYPRAWCVVNKNDHWYGSWSIGNEDGTSGKSIFYITHWRPMRGDK